MSVALMFVFMPNLVAQFGTDANETAWGTTEPTNQIFQSSVILSQRCHDTQHNDIQYNSKKVAVCKVDCHAKCRNLAVMFSVIVVRVVAPSEHLFFLLSYWNEWETSMLLPLSAIAFCCKFIIHFKIPLKASFRLGWLRSIGHRKRHSKEH